MRVVQQAVSGAKALLRTVYLNQANRYFDRRASGLLGDAKIRKVFPENTVGAVVLSNAAGIDGKPRIGFHVRTGSRKIEPIIERATTPPRSLDHASDSAPKKKSAPIATQNKATKMIRAVLAAEPLNSFRNFPRCSAFAWFSVILQSILWLNPIRAYVVVRTRRTWGHGPKRWRYSIEEINALTISASP